MRIVREAAGAGAGAITLYDFEPTPERICDDVVRGLTAEPKQLPPKYLYDERGAELFERITALDAYYLTRTEIEILRRFAPEMARMMGPRVRLVEFGSGSGEKTWLILRHLIDPVAYVPVDISCAQLIDFAARVADRFPDLAVTPVCADYTAEYLLPPERGRRSVGFFPGSTIGNFERAEAQGFLSRARRLLGEEGGMLLGVDLRKDRSIIERAYNDPEGVTAEFNLNLLARINRECGANFDPAAFRHHALFNEPAGRVEMRLVSERDQLVRLGHDVADSEVEIHFEPGEFITTEYSHKYSLGAFEKLAAASGWAVTATWTDEREWFAVFLLA